MKTTIELDKYTTVLALKTLKMSLERRQKKEINPMICELLDQDIAALERAEKTATETK